MCDTYDLQRFVVAQNAVYKDVCRELRQGHKQGHWMWFVFPQIRGLGHSSMSIKFAISSLEEAEAYLGHPLLGPRLRECTRLVNLVGKTAIHEILGYTDSMKFKSSMTLFDRATSDNQLFREALQKYFMGEVDRRTLDLL